MAKLLLIVIGGLPAVGKTTLGRALGRKLNIAFFSKDEFKEVLFDTLDFSNADPEQGKPLQKASYQLLYATVDRLGTAGQSVIIESNFMDEFDTPQIQSLANKYGYRIVQILCHAPLEVVAQRFKDRQLSGERHPKHRDDLTIQAYEGKFLTGRNYRLSLPGKLIELDMTDFTAVDYDELADRINSV